MIKLFQSGICFLNVSIYEENCAKILYCLLNVQSFKLENPILGHLGHHGLKNNGMRWSSSQGKYPMDNTSMGWFFIVLDVVGVG